METITPLAEIQLGSIPIILKLESHTRPGSHKGRPFPIIAKQLIDNGVRHALLMSSGNSAEALAYYTRDYHIELTIITDALSPREFQVRLREYKHVNLEVVNNPDKNGSHMDARRKLRQEIMKNDSSIIEVDQYCDQRIPLAYEQTLFQEIDKQLHNEVGAIFLPMGTGGLLSGALRYVCRNQKKWKIFGVDAVGSKLLWSPPRRS